jgi:hypothetical protein
MLRDIRPPSNSGLFFEESENEEDGSVEDISPAIEEIRRLFEARVAYVPNFFTRRPPREPTNTPAVQEDTGCFAFLRALFCPRRR